MTRFSLLALAGLGLAACSTSPEPNVANGEPRAAIAAPAQLPANTNFSEASWYSEQVRLSGRLFTPASATANAKTPAVVLAPAYGETTKTLDAYTAELTAQ